MMLNLLPQDNILVAEIIDNLVHTMNIEIFGQSFNNEGFICFDDIFSDAEVAQILEVISRATSNKDTFRKTDDLFAIRQFLIEVPDVVSLVFNKKLIDLISRLFGDDYFVTKSIYFDKPAKSNWFVAYHQDLTISVDQKKDLPGFGPWTVKQNQFAVQPPIEILQNNFTIRIHLDDTDQYNGALKVIPASHLKGIYRPETINWTQERESTCSVKKGGVMLMRPLLLHASGRTTNNKSRRVVHIELSNQQLQPGVSWSEKLHYQTIQQNYWVT
jgi:ectoine hydroxylase-related dioxygenase (phytanoyl-CoA dioxygenase family)